jgi:hypothetical protein
MGYNLLLRLKILGLLKIITLRCLLVIIGEVLFAKIRNKSNCLQQNMLINF